MTCLQTLSIKDKHGTRVNVPCGRCHVCLSKRRNDWSFRLYEELKTAHTANFITLTYNDDNIPYSRLTGEQTLDKRDVQLFLKKLRQKQISLFKQTHRHLNARQLRAQSPRIRYYLCGEYGTDSDRPHYHIILFNLIPELKDIVVDIWSKGHAHCGECNVKTIAYTTKYVMKCNGEKQNGRQDEFSLMSRKPAIGSGYLQNSAYHKQNRETSVTNASGAKQRLPRFYKEKMFTKGEIKAITKRDIALLDIAANQEEQRILRLGNDIAAYKLSQLKNSLAKAGKQLSLGESI